MFGEENGIMFSRIIAEMGDFSRDWGFESREREQRWRRESYVYKYWNQFEEELTFILPASANLSANIVLHLTILAFHIF